MSKINLTPNASGTGVFTIASPNSNTNRTLNLPDESGTIVSENASGDVAVTGDITSNGNAVITTQSPQLGRKNLIINGAMQVAQRATQVTGFASAGYTTCDRFVLVNTTLGAWTVDQSTDAPDGFGSSFKVTCTTADPSPDAGDRFFMYQLIEAQNLQQLAYGTSNAKNLTLSFWVKSNKIGSASVDALQNDNANKVFATTYTINSADTWEYKTISIPADTAGLINNDTGSGFQIDFWMNSGSNSTGGGVTSGWESFDNTKRNSSNLGVGGAISDYFAITGIQLEVGDVATPFEHRSFGDELARCQRYYYTTYEYGTAPSTATLNGTTDVISQGGTNRPVWTERFYNKMRAAPSLTFYSANSGTSGKVYSNTDGDINSSSFGVTSSSFKWFASGTTTSGAEVHSHWTADAEL